MPPPPLSVNSPKKQIIYRVKKIPSHVILIEKKSDKGNSNEENSDKESSGKKRSDEKNWIKFFLQFFSIYKNGKYYKKQRKASKRSMWKILKSFWRRIKTKDEKTSQTDIKIFLNNKSRNYLSIWENNTCRITRSYLVTLEILGQSNLFYGLVLEILGKF